MFRMVMATAVLCAMVFAAACSAPRKQGEMTNHQKNDGPPPVYFALVHGPGEKWQPDTPGPKQEGIGEHVAYFSRQLDAERLLMGGPFTDGSGGMMILAVETVEEAERIAKDDPAVQAGLLQVQVRPWMVPLRRGD
jgi:uncharacterized protein YciI